jgi:predicted nucleotidyltransferase
VNREEIIDRLPENEAALRARGVAHAALFGSRARGVAHAALFGSRARGDQRPESDTDIMIEFDPDDRIRSRGPHRCF